MKVKIKDLKIKDIVKCCKTYNGCYRCPLSKLGHLCNGNFAHTSEEQLNIEVKL